MKKYKHKNTDIIVLHEEVGRYTILDWGIFTPMKGNVSLNFDFNNSDWEEVKEEIKISNLNVKEEPNYLITAFRSTKDKSLARINALGLYDFGIPLEDFLTGDNSIEDGKWEIYSVKNSKGEEFTIGDEIVHFNTHPNSKFKIGQFFIRKDTNQMLVRQDDSHGARNEFLEYIIKIKTPIYTTTDGVDIKEGSCFTAYLLNKDLSIVKPFSEVNISRFSKQDAEVASRYLTFTSEENRDKYIKETQNKTELDKYNKILEDRIYEEFSRKPIFVSADGVELFEEPEYVYSVLTKGLWPMERNYFYNHQYKSPEWKHFVTKEARQEYIDNNKPKYSLADVKQVLKWVDDKQANIALLALKKLGK